MLSPLRFEPACAQPALPVAAASVIRYAAGEEIFAEGDSADHVYELVEGTVRTGRLLRDGRRQIDAFHFAGEAFGFEAGEVRRTTAEAVSEVTVRIVRRRALSDLAARDGQVARQLYQLTISGLQRSQDHVLMLGRRSACERVAGLLLLLADRTGEAAFDLPMSRQDMADYLGLTIETVSRTLTGFLQEGLIALPTVRHVELLDRDALEALCE
ncbi:helix-turn-helix domain-containing protein [Caulobacter sp. CCNWLY153]|uniref:Transcriptional regulator n=1 Tax=Caulobacter radicis TaxID=2172650 RepID=A0A2T9JDB2_9CAUL|nr:helix-turn-helix domain-containing protein [Caulobacter radicis]PVM80921.1 transcriptional regulator [Caulobacter radicis]